MRYLPGSLRPRGLHTLAVAALAVLLAAKPAIMNVGQREPYAPIGLFFGSIEEGARIFTPTRFLPFDHPEALGHQFPTVLQLHGSEFPLLLWLGEQAGYRLWPTLERYPTAPATDWPYRGFRQPPDTIALRGARVERRARTEAPLPGLRAALFDGPALVAFIVDTHRLSLAERGMARATSMGLDLTRAEFLARVQRGAPANRAAGFSLVLYSP